MLSIKWVNNKSVLSSERGFSLIELMIVMTIMLIISSAAYAVFIADLKTYTTQDHIVRMNQDVRFAVSQMSRKMRMAGFDPMATLSGKSKVFGITDNNYKSIATATTITSDREIYFTIDADEDGVIDNNGNERVGYRIIDSDGDGKLDRLQRGSGVGNWQTLKENVVGLNFMYTYADGDLSSGAAGLPNNTDPDLSNDFEDIRLIKITLTSRTSKEDRQFTDGFNLRGTAADGTCRTKTLSAHVKARNIGI